MKDRESSTLNEGQPLHGTCPFCLSKLDVYLDVKGRPYWTCLPCGTRTFATRVALQILTEAGWIWCGQFPLKAVKSWLRHVSKTFKLKTAL